MRLSALSSVGLITMSLGMVYFKARGASIYEELGIVDPMELKPEFQDQQIYDPRGGSRILAEQDTTRTTLTLSMTLKMLTPRVRALSVASDLTYENQAAVTAGTKSIVSIAAGDVYDIGKLSLSNYSLVDLHTAPVSYVEGTNYQVDAEAGLLRVISIPGGANANAVFTYDAAGILTAAKQPRIGLANNPDLRGSLIFRGTNDVGVKCLIKIPDCQFRPSAGRPLVSENYTEVQISGLVFADTTQAAGEELGYECTL